MAYNLFIAYDLMSPGQNYDIVRKAIGDLGIVWQFQFSLFYVHTEHAPEVAFDLVQRVLDGNDKLAVINAERGIVTNWDHPPTDVINTIWSAP